MQGLSLDWRFNRRDLGEDWGSSENREVTPPFWYTGAAGWLYRAGLEWILGFHKRGSDLCIDPCIPKE
jgi:cellobiose phosphorylase